VVLRLQASNGAGPTIQKGFTASASIADAPRLALVALRELLPAFLDPERRYDPTALEQRDPAAIAAFLEGERYYRASRFEEAVARYQTAVQRDSLLAVAALKAAQAQSWLNRTADAVEYADLALRHIRLLPPRYAVFASGLRHYLRGDGDSTIALTRPLVGANPDWTDAWFLLGEAYLHLMPSTPVAQQEAMADSAYRMVEQSDSAFAPAREHMLDIALRRRKIARAESLAVMSRRTLSADDARWLDAILRCVRDGPSSVDWNGLRNRSPRAAWRWGETLVFEPANAACARAAFAVTLALPAAAPRELWGAVVGTNALLVAAGRDADAGRLLQGNAAESVRGWALLFPDAAAGADVERAAARKADSLGTNFDRLATPYLWVLTSWYSGRGDSVVLGRIAASMAVRRDSTHRHLDSLVAAVAAAHVAAARHDTSSALRLLEPLRPVAPYTDLMWQPWEAFAGERMLQASLLAGKGRLDEAIRVASKMDVQVPMINLIYLRRSLELRERWSLQLRDTVAAARYRMELDHWSAAIR
jgi:tetratricopeptide (TPR) repeat protein